MGKLAINSVGTGQLQSGSVGSVQIQMAAIETAHIQDAAISKAKIGEAAVGTAQIEDAAIIRAKIAQGAIGSAQIGDASITSGLLTYIAYVAYADPDTGLTINATADIFFALISTGENAKSAWISGEQVFKYTSAGAVFPAQITLTANLQNVTMGNREGNFHCCLCQRQNAGRRS